MKKITLKLTKLQQKALLEHLGENICRVECFMYRETGHFPKYAYDCHDCPMKEAVYDIENQLYEQVEEGVIK